MCRTARTSGAPKCSVIQAISTPLDWIWASSSFEKWRSAEGISRDPAFFAYTDRYSSGVFFQEAGLRWMVPSRRWPCWSRVGTSSSGGSNFAFNSWSGCGPRRVQVSCSLFVVHRT
jgi:hypothetical protein